MGTTPAQTKLVLRHLINGQLRLTTLKRNAGKRAIRDMRKHVGTLKKYRVHRLWLWSSHEDIKDRNPLRILMVLGSGGLSAWLIERLDVLCTEHVSNGAASD